jgi:undecaprenyl-diphosphatase
VVGALLGKTIRKYLYFNNVLATFLILGGVFLIFVEKQLGRMRNNLNEPDSLEKIEPALMHKIGLAQAISILPGVSRLVCTVGSALLLGLTRKMAVDFSYFISIPVGLAGSLFDILGELMTTGMSNYPALIGYFTISMVFALFFVKIMLDFLRSRRLSVFGYYRVLMGAVILLFFRG